MRLFTIKWNHVKGYEEGIICEDRPYPHVSLGQGSGMTPNDRAGINTDIAVNEGVYKYKLLRASVYRKNGKVILGPEVKSDGERVLILVKEDRSDDWYPIKVEFGSATQIAYGRTHGLTNEELYIVEPLTAMRLVGPGRKYYILEYDGFEITIRKEQE